MAGYAYSLGAKVDSAGIEGAAREYWEAWYSGDGERLRAVLHPRFELRGLAYRVLDARTSNYVAIDVVTQDELVYLAGLGVGETGPDTPQNEVTVLAATRYVASVQTVGEGQTHLLHLMQFPGGWKVVGTIYSHDDGMIPNQTYDM